MRESENSQNLEPLRDVLERCANRPISGGGQTSDLRENERLLEAVERHLGPSHFAPVERLLRAYVKIRVGEGNIAPQLQVHVRTFHTALCAYALSAKDSAETPTIDTDPDRKLVLELRKRCNAVRFFNLNALLGQFAGLAIDSDTGDARDRSEENVLLAEIRQELHQSVQPIVDAGVNRGGVFWIERDEIINEFYARFVTYLRRRRTERKAVEVSAGKFLGFFVRQAINHLAKGPSPMDPDAGPPVPDPDPLPSLNEARFDQFVESMKTTLSRRCTELSDPNAEEERDATLRLGALLFLPFYEPETAFAAHFGISDAGKNRLKLYWAEFIAGAFHDILENADLPYVPRQRLTIEFSRKGTYGPWISHCFIFCWNECADAARGQLAIDPTVGCKALHQFWLFSSGQTRVFQPLGGFFVETAENPPPAHLVSYRKTGPERGLVCKCRKDELGD